MIIRKNPNKDFFLSKTAHFYMRFIQKDPTCIQAKVLLICFILNYSIYPIYEIGIKKIFNIETDTHNMTGFFIYFMIYSFCFWTLLIIFHKIYQEPIRHQLIKKILTFLLMLLIFCIFFLIILLFNIKKENKERIWILLPLFIFILSILLNGCAFELYLIFKNLIFKNINIWFFKIINGKKYMYQKVFNRKLYLFASLMAIPLYFIVFIVGHQSQLYNKINTMVHSIINKEKSESQYSLVSLFFFLFLAHIYHFIALSFSLVFVFKIVKRYSIGVPKMNAMLTATLLSFFISTILLPLVTEIGTNDQLASFVIIISIIIFILSNFYCYSLLNENIS